MGLTVTNTVLGFVIAAIAIMIGVVVFYNVQVATPTTALPATAQTIIGNVGTTAGSGFSLLTVALIVIAAAVIIGILVRALGGVGGGGP
jgi:hypothetical protein